MHVCAVIGGLSGERAVLAAYVLRTLLGTLGLPHEIATKPPDTLAGRVAVWYGRPAPDTDAAACVEIACLEPPTPDEAVRCLAADPPAVVADGAGVRIDADIVAQAGLWLTGADEADDACDNFGRVCGARTPRGRAGLLHRPVVTELMGVLWQAIRQAAEAAALPITRTPAWPQGRRFAVLLSHDVDLWRKRTARQLAKEMLRSARTPWRLAKVARAFCCGPDPWAHLAGIADLEARRGMHSTFFVLPGRPNRVVDGVGVVNGYNAPAQAVGDTLKGLVARGWDVGLHGSFDSFASAADLAAERGDVAALAGTDVVACRQHFLRFHRPNTWRSQLEAGLTCDATLGYHDTDGYRAGFSFPFHPFDGEELPLLELPLVVMDGALHERQGMDADAAWERVRSYLERTEADGALCSLLWHNHYFCGLDAPGYGAVYERALDWIQEHGGWGASAREICEWWRQRSAVEGV